MRTWIVIAMIAMLAVGCGGNKAKQDEGAAEDTAAKQEMNTMTTDMPDLNSLEMVDGPEGMKYAITVEGEGEPIGTGRMAVVHYTGWLTDGNKFDSSKKRAQPFQFITGRGQVIRGWDIGVSAMKVGETRVLVLPPELAYGERGAGGVIPPNATLVFEVEVLEVR